MYAQDRYIAGITRWGKVQ